MESQEGSSRTCDLGLGQHGQQLRRIGDCRGRADDEAVQVTPLVKIL